MGTERKRLRISSKVSIILLLLALLLAGGGIGLGLSGVFSENVAPSVTSQTNATSSAPEPAKTTIPALEPTETMLENLIFVRETSCYYLDVEYELSALREVLLANYTGTQVFELVDDHARKATYDAVKLMLEDLDIRYIEKQF